MEALSESPFRKGKASAEFVTRTEINEKGEILLIKQGEFRYANGDRFVGQTVNEKRSGQGTLYLVNNDVYIGGFKNGSFDGFGTYSGAPIRNKGVETSGMRYTGEWKLGQRHGKGEFSDSNGDKYEGTFVNNKFSGYGVMRYGDGRMYTGTWLAGTWHGQGRLTFANGDSYVGNFSMGRYHGQGMLRYGGGGSYSGEWRRDNRHGVGRRVWASGSEYEGEWKSDKRCGRGIYKSAAGDIYVGTFYDDRYHGEGILVTVDGRRYHGQFAHGIFSGMGSLKNSDGSSYVGEYNAQLRCGVTSEVPKTVFDLSSSSALYNVAKVIQSKRAEGSESKEDTVLMRLYEEEAKAADKTQFHEVMTKSGHIIVGTEEDIKWMSVHTMDNPRTAPALDGKKHGYGTFTWASGASYTGNWFQDVMEGSGKYTNFDGSTYDGDWKDGKRHGKGVATYCNNGEAYVCPLGFSHDGNGHCTYEGEWENDLREGYGTLTCCDGRQYRGDWRADKRHGYGVLVLIPDTVKGMGNRQLDQIGRVWSCTYTATRIYRGEFVEDRREGEGTAVLVNGDELWGHFKENKLHGPVRHYMKIFNKDVYAMYSNGVRKYWMTGADKKRLILQQKRPDLWEIMGERAVETWTEEEIKALAKEHDESRQPTQPTQKRAPRVIPPRPAPVRVGGVAGEKMSHVTRATMDELIPFRKPNAIDKISVAKGTVKLSPLFKKRGTAGGGGSGISSAGGAGTHDEQRQSKEAAEPASPFAFKLPAWLNELD